MESFSQRKGLKPIKTVMQLDSMDDELRNSLWNALTEYYWNSVKPLPHKVEYRLSFSSNQPTKVLIRRLWKSFFVKPIDEISDHWDNVYDKLRNYFFKCSWNEAYDFVEFVANNYPDKYINRDFINNCNYILEKEVSGYRFAAERIAQITTNEEIGEIEDALQDSPKTVRIHIKAALDLLSDRKSPDYRNSIKESISAVEAVCKKIANDDKATLEQALKEMEKRTVLHPALKKGFSSIYGYTSDAEGIRHALMKEPGLDFEDAKFMLVSCSAFINYLVAKAAKADIKL